MFFFTVDCYVISFQEYRMHAQGTLTERTREEEKRGEKRLLSFSTFIFIFSSRRPAWRRIASSQLVARPSPSTIRFDFVYLADRIDVSYAIVDVELEKCAPRQWGARERRRRHRPMATATAAAMPSTSCSRCCRSPQRRRPLKHPSRGPVRRLRPQADPGDHAVR